MTYIINQYAAINKNWRGSKGGVELSKLGTLIEATWSVLSKIWDSPHDYPEKRFLRLVEVFEGEIKNSIRLSFTR